MNGGNGGAAGGGSEDRGAMYKLAGMTEAERQDMLDLREEVGVFIVLPLSRRTDFRENQALIRYTSILHWCGRHVLRVRI